MSSARFQTNAFFNSDQNFRKSNLHKGTSQLTRCPLAIA